MLPPPLEYYDTQRAKKRRRRQRDSDEDKDKDEDNFLSRNPITRGKDGHAGIHTGSWVMRVSGDGTALTTPSQPVAIYYYDYIIGICNLFETVVAPVNLVRKVPFDVHQLRILMFINWDYDDGSIN